MHRLQDSPANLKAMPAEEAKFEAFAAVKLIQQLVDNLNIKGSTFLTHPVQLW